MSKSLDKAGAQSIACAAGVIVNEDRYIRNSVSDRLEMCIEFILCRLQEHRLQDRNTCHVVSGCHLSETYALLRVDRADTEIDRDTAGSLVHHDLEAALHLILFDLIEFTVRAESEDTVKTALDDELDLTAHSRFIDFFIFINDSNNGDDNTLNIICIHIFLQCRVMSSAFH